MKILKFGKKYQDISVIKKNFLKDNDFLLKKQNKISLLYKKQPIRKFCKVCMKKIKGEFFINHGIKYIKCKYCTHINGKYQDTIKFSNKIYLSNSINYSKNYRSINKNSFILRQKKIYNPKADFLKKILKNNMRSKILDFGCGSGYFVSSLIDKGFKNVEGVELSKNQISYGKKIFKKINKDQNILKYCERANIDEHIRTTNANCITLIGVLEHLVDIHSLLKNIYKNKNIKYIFLCVPMFSLSCLIENSFSSIFNRHLGGGHTHLFTEKSLKYLMQKYKFFENAAWWFGTDFPDLHRSLLVNSIKKNSKALNCLTDDFVRIIDDLQLALDKQKLSSQVHIVFKKK